jgi:hypothetical protein
MKPAADETSRMWKVSSRMGNVKNNDRALIEEIA